MKEGPPAQKSTPNFLESILVGGLSQAISKTAFAPIERLQIIFQTQDVHPYILTGKTKKYQGILPSLIRIYRETGFRSLYRGNLTNIFKFFPSRILTFSLKDSFKIQVDQKSQINALMANLLSSGLASLTTYFIVYPFEFIRTRLAADIGPQYKGVFHMIQQIRSSDGILGFYHGFSISILAPLVYRGLYFGIYDSVKVNFDRQTSMVTKFFVAQYITFFVGTACYPLFTVKRRLIMRAGRKDKIYEGNLDCIKKIAKNEGFKGFYKGFACNIVKSFSGSVMLVSLDTYQDLYKNFF